MNQELTQAKLKEIIDYNPVTGIFTNKITRNNKAKQGNRAGSLRLDGYMAVVINYKTYKLHHLAFLYMNGELPNNDVRHKNRNTLDNSFNNLKISSRSESMRTPTKKMNRESIGLKGVYYCPYGKCYRAYFRHNKNKIEVGRYSCPKEAHQAYLDAKSKYLQAQKLDGIGS